MTLYSGYFCTDQEVDLVGTSSELDNEDDDDEGEEEDDYYDDEDDSNIDGGDFDGLSLNEEAEIMQYAIGNAAQSASLSCVGDLQHLTRCGKQYCPNNQIFPDDPNNKINNKSYHHHLNSPNCDLATTTCQNPSNSGDSIPNLSMYNSSEKLIIESSLFDTKTRIIGNGIVLLVSTFAMLVLLPLYFQQMVQNGDHFNVFGATIFVSCNAALIFIIITVALGVAIKWNIPFYKPPLPWTKLITISLCYGLSCILFATSCYTRVPCHLQDPLKGVALVFSLIFYFFFCRKIMGLQRIFSATTAVVGLFISVDYGLCDEFRCRGTDLTDKFFETTSTVDTSALEWKPGFIWALLYITSIALWALHISLLESSLVLSPTMGKRQVTLKPMGLLRTVSRMVSKTESTLPTVIHTPTKTHPMKKIENELPQENVDLELLTTDAKSHPLHIAVWVHVLSVFVVGVVGWIDIFPVAGPMKTLGRHWTDSGNTILCHLNMGIDVYAAAARDNGGEELLTNFVPGSMSFNETVHKSRRFRRSPTRKDLKSHHSLELHFNYTTSHHAPNATAKKHLNHSKTHNGSGHVKNEKHIIKTRPSPWKWSAGKQHRVNSSLENGLNEMLSDKQRPATSTTDPIGNCSRTQIYSLILLLFYIIFASCLINFLVISESAVFTVCVVSGALPLIGIFWSLFEISFDSSDQTVGLIWSPELSGELICSLLGMPIVFLGIGLLCHAYFREHAILLEKQLSGCKSDVGTAPSAIFLSFENQNYTSANSYLETGLSDDSANNQNGCSDNGYERTSDLRTS